jgi:hypothetical protein
MNQLSESAIELQQKALENAVTGESVANYQAIFDGFTEKGIAPADILPRVNVFTFNAWKALGRVVKKDEHGVRVVTVIPYMKKDPETGERKPATKPKATTVFHISQTQPLADVPAVEASQVISETAKPAVEAQPVVEALPQIEPEQGEDEARPLNAYEAKLEARRDRYEDRATSARTQSAATHRRAHDMASVIPFGQPILVGHHSERRDRNFRGKINRTFEKSFELQKTADYYDSKAASVGTGGISSDDPDAVQKLRKQLESAERTQATMKAANKAIRSNKTPESQKAALVALGYTEAGAAQVLEKNCFGQVGFPSFSLTNNSANIRRLKSRVADLEKHKQRVDVEKAGNGFTYREDTAENRVMFVFEGKPDEATRKLLGDNSFNWSPTRKAWIRKLTNAGLWAAKEVMKKLG